VPHMVFENGVDVEVYWRDFKPSLERDGASVLKLERCFLDSERQVAQVEAFVIEGHLRQKFLVSLSAKDDGSVTVHLEPFTDPQKTPGVHRIIAMIAEDVSRRFPAATAGNHNLHQVLKAKIPGA